MAVQLEVGLTGVEEAIRMLGGVPAAVDQLIEDVTISLRNIVEGRTPVLTGHLKGSWSQVQRGVEKGSFAFSTDVSYATILEEGLYRRVGPRTVELSGGIYSRQAPGGILAPLIADEALVERIVSEVVKRFMKG